MKSTYFFAALPTVIIFAISSYAVTHAFFSNSATSTSNTFTASANFPPNTNHVVISEVQTATPSAVNSDFIELYNPTSFSIDLNGLRLVKRTKPGVADTDIKIWNSSTIIPSHKYYLWASTAGGFNTQVGADASSGDALADDNSVAIKVSTTSAVIDAVAWGSGHTAPLVEGSPFATNSAAGQSLERKSYSTSTAASMAVGGIDELKGNGYDTDDNINDFIDRLTPQPQNSSSVAETP